jgi:hypothetical protein
MVPSRETRSFVPIARILLAPAALVIAVVGLVLPASGGASAEATAPKNTAEPAISGQPEEGRTLSASQGTWSGSTPLSFAYRWVRCGADGGLPDGSNCVFISGATKSKYQLVRADVGFRMRVRVTATNSVGSATAASNATQAVVGPPVNTSPPKVEGTLVIGSVITADPGTWSGRQPIQFSYRWLRCNTAGGGCVSIGGGVGSGRTYELRSADLGHKMRFYVTAKNVIASRTALSGESPVVTEPLPAGAVKLATGEISIPVASIPRDQRMYVAKVTFTPSFVRSRTHPITVRVKVQDTRGYVVRDALVFIRSTPRVTTGATQPTAMDGSVTFQLVPLATFPAKRSAVQFFVKAYRTGDPPLAGVAGYRLVQVLIDTRRPAR